MGADTYLNADHYVMLGNFDRDPDRFSNVRRIVCEFLRSLNLGPSALDETVVDAWLNVAENSQELVGASGGRDAAPQERAQATRLAAWTEVLEREELMNYVLSSYEVVPLLSEYSPRINASN